MLFLVRVVLRFGEMDAKGLFPSSDHELATFSGQPSGMRVFGLLLAFLLSLTPLGARPLAAGPCILPVTGEEPLTEVERDQPYRLAANPITIPGHGGLLLRPVNRTDHLHFYEIVGKTYRARARPAPGSNIIDGDVQLAVGGDYFLPGWDDRVLWQLPAGSDAWQEAWPGQKWWGTAYDEGTQDFYAGFAPKAPLLRWDGKAFVPAGPMPTAFGEAPSSLTEFGLPRAILTLPDAGGTFAVAVDWYNEDRRSLWFRPGGGAWAVVATQQDLDRLTPGLRFPGPFRDADVSDDGQTVRLFSNHLKDASILLRRGPNGWILEEAAPYQGWVKHRDSGIRLAWSGEFSQDLTESVLLFFERSVPFKPAVLQALDPGTLVPRPVTGVTPKVEIGAKAAFNLSTIVDVPGVAPLLVETETGWMAFDGKGFRDLPGWDANRIGENARIFRVGALKLIRSLNGVFRLTDELEAEPVLTFPEGTSPSPTTSVTWLEEAGLFVVVGSNAQAVFTSRDFVSFERVPSPVPITSAVAVLPDRPGMLLVGTDGLYSLEADCPQDG
ncbi:MAG: hypothetical protein EOP88_23560 [Verrucomicrobiaceae bacterium]|nr:MAG: hypothetical protein EOP88_23560 [Verrucomicrobiaceae bacterium]